MSFLHSTPTKAATYTISGEPFQRDFIEWRDELWDRSELLIDAQDDWMLINWDHMQSNTNQLLNQNIGRATPKQRFVNAVRQVGRALGVLKMMRRLRLRKALAAVKHQRKVAERKAAVKQRKLFDYSEAYRELSYFSLDDADD